MEPSSQLKKRIAQYAYGQTSLDDLYRWYSDSFPNLATNFESQQLVAALESELLSLSRGASESDLQENLKALLAAVSHVQQVTVKFEMFANYSLLQSTGNPSSSQEVKQYEFVPSSV
ncbi:MAG TPA: hypothetical protein VKR82_06535 [Candidatus Acidoferrales bacterium]|nr:hypothetical protein [Candidatus Acidoferrales bacterium]